MNIKDYVIELKKDDLSFKNRISLKDDIIRLYQIKKTITRFINTGKINDKLLINNIVITINTFGIEETNIMFEKIYKKHFDIIKPILIFLKCYTLWDNETQPNEIIQGILNDTINRYNLK